jgi:hypothetical protein
MVTEFDWRVRIVGLDSPAPRHRWRGLSSTPRSRPQIDIRASTDPEHLDSVAFSARKMPAPWGAGAVVGARGVFRGGPEYRGGGTVDVVTATDVTWAGLADREESGSPNVVAAVAMAAAARARTSRVMAAIGRHEGTLTAYAPTTPSGNRSRPRPPLQEGVAFRLRVKLLRTAIDLVEVASSRLRHWT